MKTEAEIRNEIEYLEHKKSRAMHRIGGYDANGWYRIKKEFDAKIDMLKWVLGNEE